MADEQVKLSSKNKFSCSLTVTTDHLDALNHVNNEVYLRWLLYAAGAHSSSLGFTMARFLEDGACFVVRRHEIDYLAPAYLNDQITIETWIESIVSTRSKRCYKIIRSTDAKVLVEANTLWVYVDIAKGRPLAIPQIFSEMFL